MGDGTWSSAGRLYMVTPDGIATWDPVSGPGKLQGPEWIAPDLGPGGLQVAYTYYAGASFLEADLRVGVVDLQTGRTLVGLPDQPRSQAGFVGPTTLWYLEEGPCGIPSGCFSGDVAPTGRVLAFDTAAGTETPVTFAPGESPVTLEDYGGFSVRLPPA